MAKGATAKRYAQALFLLAQEQGKTEAWLDQLQKAQEVLTQPTVSLYLTQPRVRPEQKLEVVSQLLAEADQLVVNLAGLLTTRASLGLVPGILRVYAELLNDSLGRVRASTVSAVELSPEQRARIQSALSVMLNKEVVLETFEDPEIMGGIIVRVGDQVIDGSVRARLGAMRQRLTRQAVI
jgi:F-type H+-transporting ATPase subunit delta